MTINTQRNTTDDVSEATRMSEKLVDPDFGIRPQARALLAYLSEFSIDLPLCWMLWTWAWYNGREKCFCITVETGSHKRKPKTFVVVAGECRGSDSLFVDSWAVDGSLYGESPKVHEPTPAAYKARKTFSPGRFDQAQEAIYEAIRAFAAKEGPEGWEEGPAFE